ncbi:uncharacterized protein FOMMEDRAFT_146262 [Fomitiporia mediterranea MF3/22]|uniref:uncharacterized protein n=1 Tax=Fomitiporia mediterranea (strain MF3/22) TaxID=694068 RepID=UPI0004407F2D|nr:uncharacterized protein FOMMEDRAFT_146262 [Fomitiporia mediterranea MF3/22]EJD04273.1 hypothetical protein FOMMEDRAFT_146262 [Fomitiporia mediterranea MF3/22]
MSSPSESASTPRVSTSDKPQQGPIAIFEHHLRYLQDSYLSFFQERAKIEESYVDSLLRLHKKTKTIDIYLDHATEPSTVRQVWSEIRDGLEREAQCRMAFISALTVDVINPISALKETQDRTRKRIKDDLKESAAAHQDYAENVLPRLKRTYFKKCQEVEDNKLNALSPTNTGTTEASVALSPTRSNPNTSPVVTNPQPLRPLSRRASGHQPRNRSPSASNPLHDLANQGKRQLNQLMTFLDNKGGSLKEGVSGSKGDMAVRSVRAKREADEADKEYRKGVHWLETLRLRRSKILEGAFQSLELFIDEAATQLKTVLEKYTANALATSTTVSHLASHAQGYVSHISPQKEVSSLATIKSRYIKQTMPRRTLYTNYYVGDCNDLIFGVSLVDYATSRGLQEGEVPKLVHLCIAEVDKRGLNAEGIYRVSGRHAVVQEMIHKLERDEKNFQFYPSDDIFVVAALLKQYLRELPEPLFKFALEDRIKHTEGLEEHVQNNFLFLRGKLRRLPAVHQATFKALIEHLARVAANSERNKMDPKNLAIIFGGVVFGEDEISKSTDLLSMQSWKDSLMEDMIVHANLLFDDKGISASPSKPPRAPPSQSPSPPPNMPGPLPPARSETSTADSDYGASYTQISHALLEPQRPETESPSASTQDFTPTLPARPGNSIHPSHRSANQSRSTESETDDEVAPPLPPRPPKLEARAMHASESSVSGSQASPLSERPDESVAGTTLTSPDVAPSSPSPVRSPLVLHSDSNEESLPEHQSQPPRGSHESARRSHERTSSSQ